MLVNPTDQGDLALAPRHASEVVQDIAAIARIGAVPSLLKLLCQNSGMGFAAVARVTDSSWVACAVEDNIGFGLGVGGELDVSSTLCVEARAARAPIVIASASEDPVYRDHHTPRIYGIQGYISVPIVRSNGEYFGNLCAIDPRPAPLLKDPAVVAMFKAYAELIAMQLESDEIREAATAALLDEREASELREHFVAVLGHDLRNPLAAISASAQLLARQSKDEKVLGATTRIAKATRRMASLIDDVLDLARSRLGAGIGAVLAPVDNLQAALEDVLDEIRVSHPERSLVDDIEIEGTVVCDLGRIQQLLSNLVGNAISHGAADQPITVGADVQHGWLSIWVENGGKPIDAEVLAKVFAPYWRPASSKPGGGLGLGLYICSQIATAHGGHMAVSSTVQQTRFTAQIPTRPSA